jgi:hypothetical protein
MQTLGATPETGSDILVKLLAIGVLSARTPYGAGRIVTPERITRALLAGSCRLDRAGAGPGTRARCPRNDRAQRRADRRVRRGRTTTMAGRHQLPPKAALKTVARWLREHSSRQLTVPQAGRYNQGEQHLAPARVNDACRRVARGRSKSSVQQATEDQRGTDKS